MMFQWSADTLRWYRDAVAYTGYGRALADQLTPYLSPHQSLCDMGCGSGFLSLELARRGYSVTAVDRSPVATQALRQAAEAEGLTGITVITANWTDLGNSPRWDQVLAVCTGRQPEKMARFSALCRHRLVVVDRSDRSSHVRPGALSVRRLELAEPEHYSFRTSFTLEFGQPLTSLEDAKNYFRQVGGISPTTASLDALVATDHPQFPYYLPHQKALELMVVNQVSQQR